MPVQIEYILIAMCLSILYLAWTHHYREMEWERRFRQMADGYFEHTKLQHEVNSMACAMDREFQARISALEGLRDSTILKRPLTALPRRA